MPVRLALIASLLAVSHAASASDLGTAGPFRRLGGVQCEAPGPNPAAQACDPALVDSSLPATERSEAHLARALKFLDLLRLAQARAELDEAIRASPTNAAALHMRGRLSLTNGNLTLTEADFNAALAMKPDDPDVLASRAYIRDSLEDANASVKLRTDNPDALWIRAGILQQHDDLHGAEADLDLALEREPQVRRARLLRAQVRLALGNYKGAAGDATYVLAEGGLEPFALHTRAAARIALNDPEGALADLTSALGPSGVPSTAHPGIPVFRDMLVQRAMVLARLGRRSDALRDIDHVLHGGGRPAVLRLQLYLRFHGFPEVPLDGERSALLEDSLTRCFLELACGKGMRI
jgi:tetratricopeptide (TPR) repeat protein